MGSWRQQPRLDVVSRCYTNDGGDLSGAHLLANPRGLCAFMKGKGLHLCGGQRRIEGREGVRIDRDSSIFRGGQRIFLELRMFCR